MGIPIIGTDENDKPQTLKDEDDVPLMGHDKDGKPVYGYDDKGRPVHTPLEEPKKGEVPKL